jgi:hypothetical protein
LKEEGIPHFKEIRQFTFSDGRFVHVRLFCSPRSHKENNAQIITVDLDPDVDDIEEFIPGDDESNKKKSKKRKRRSDSKPKSAATAVSNAPSSSSSSAASSSLPPSSASSSSSSSSSSNSIQPQSTAQPSVNRNDDFDMDIEKEINATPTSTKFASILRVIEQRATSLSPVITPDERANEMEQLEQRKETTKLINVKRQRAARMAFISPYRTEFQFASIKPRRNR